MKPQTQGGAVATVLGLWSISLVFVLVETFFEGVTATEDYFDSSVMIHFDAFNHLSNHGVIIYSFVFLSVIDC